MGDHEIQVLTMGHPDASERKKMCAYLTSVAFWYQEEPRQVLGQPGFRERIATSNTSEKWSKLLLDLAGNPYGRGSIAHSWYGWISIKLKACSWPKGAAGGPDSGQSLTVSFASVPLARKTFQ
jgi:hypothetical protein